MPRKYYRIVSLSIGWEMPIASAIENGAGTSVKTAHKIADAVGRPFEELFEVQDAR